RALMAKVLGEHDRGRGRDEQSRHRESGDQAGGSILLAQIPGPVVPLLAPVPPVEPAWSSPSTTAIGSPAAMLRTSLSIASCFWIPVMPEITCAHCWTL